MQLSLFNIKAFNHVLLILLQQTYIPGIIFVFKFNISQKINTYKTKLLKLTPFPFYIESEKYINNVQRKEIEIIRSGLQWNNNPHTVVFV